MKKENKALLNRLYLEYQKEKYPSVPENYHGQKAWSDSTTNSLTRCVVNFLNLSGWQAERISTTGRVLDQKQQFTDVMGVRKTIGSTKYIPGQGTKGSADISATIAGRSVKIEIKFGADRQSEAQKRYQENIEKAGGIYLIVRDFDSFIEWYDSSNFKNVG